MINELIRKTDVLDLLNDLANDFGDNYALYSTLFDSVDGMEAANVENLPSVQPKAGHWFDVGSLSCRCSCCGCKSKQESRFCPNCGAKMEEETKRR